MNALLNFKHNDYHQKFYEDHQHHLKYSRNILAVVALLNIVAGDIVDSTLGDIYRLMWAARLTRGVLAFLSVLVISLIQRYSQIILEKIFHHRPKLTFFAFEIIEGISILGLHIIFMHFDLVHLSEVSLHSNSLLFVEGVIYSLKYVTMIHILNNWIMRATVIFGNTLYLVTFSPTETRESIYLILSGLIAVLCFSFVMYLQERHFKMIFLNSSKKAPERPVWRQLLNNLPEGVLIIDDKMNPIFHNSSLKDLLLSFANSDINSDITPNYQKMFERITITSTFDPNIPRSNEKLADDQDPQSGSGSAIGQLPLVQNLLEIVNSVFEKIKETSYKGKKGDASSDQTIQPLLILESTVRPTFIGPDRIKTKFYQIQLSRCIFENRTALIFIFTDITELKRIIKSRDQQDYKSRVISSVSHELRTPLNGSLSFLQSLLDDSRIPDDLKINSLTPLKMTILLLTHVVSDIIDYSQIEADKFTLVVESKSIVDTVRESMKMVELQAQKKDLELNLDTDELVNPYFSTDHQRVKQIVLNLLSNAVKFSKNGMICVKVRSKDVHLGGEPMSSGGPKKLEISVQDFGVGISHEEMRKLFQKHLEMHTEKLEVNRKGNPNGVGLGLLVSNKIASFLGPRSKRKAKNPSLIIKSEVGKGSIFSFELEEKKVGESLSPSLASFKLSVKNDSRPNSINELVGTGNQSGQHSPRSPQTRPTSKGNISPDAIYRRRPSLFQRQATEKAPSFQDISLSYSSNRELLENEEIDSLTSRLAKYRFDSFPNRRNTPRSTSRVLTVRTAREPKFCNCHRILVVDDDGFNIMAYETLFSSLKIPIDIAFDGKSAIDKVTSKYAQALQQHCVFCQSSYQLVIMDLTMPVMDGYEATETLKQMMSEDAIPRFPIVACSAIVQNADSEMVMRAGFDDYIVKPITKDKILMLLHKFNFKFK